MSRSSEFPGVSMMTMTRESLLADVRFLVDNLKSVDARDGIRRLRRMRAEFERIHANPRYLTHDDEATLYAMRQWYLSQVGGGEELRVWCERRANEYLQNRVAENMVIVVHFEELLMAVKNAIVELQDVLQIGAKYRAKLYARSIRQARNNWAAKRVTCYACGKEYLQSNKTKHERTKFHENACKNEENIRLVVVEKTL